MTKRSAVKNLVDLPQWGPDDEQLLKCPHCKVTTLSLGEVTNSPGRVVVIEFSCEYAVCKRKSKLVIKPDRELGRAMMKWEE